MKYLILIISFVFISSFVKSQTKQNGSFTSKPKNALIEKKQTNNANLKNKSKPENKRISIQENMLTLKNKSEKKKIVKNNLKGKNNK